ncbi:MAG TPA: glycosyl hydrolase, partial [Chitinophaga sp.]
DFDDDGQYMERYPGDAFVDVIGFDLYHSGSAEQYQQLLRQRLQILEAVAAVNHKIPALTETGQERLPAANWWTQTLLPALRSFQLSYVLVWRNGRPDHYYAPYPGQASEADFKKFRADERTLFLQDLK